MLHRVLLGSVERFVGTLIEHYNADLPLWLAPLQALVIPIKDTVMDYAQKIVQALKAEGVRVEIDSHNETLDKKIRNAEMSKVPYCLVIGEREEKSGSVSVRQKGKGNIGALNIDAFIKKIKEEIEKKAV